MYLHCSIFALCCRLYLAIVEVVLLVDDCNAFFELDAGGFDAICRVKALVVWRAQTTL